MNTDVVKCDSMKLLLIEQIGSGARAVVWKAKDVVTGGHFAIKVARADTHPGRLHREYYILKNFDHKNIINPVLFHQEHVAKTNTLTNYMVLPMLSKDLFARVIEDGVVMGEPEIKKLIIDIGGALRYIHDEHHMIHRDVKPENILIDGGGNYILCDFESATACDPTKMSTAIGTLGYTAPEIVHSYNYRKRCSPFTVGKPVDIYAFGMTLYNISAKAYGGPNIRTTATMGEMLDAMENHDMEKQIDSLPSVFSDSYKNLLKMMMLKSPVARITASELFTHPFMLS